METTLERIILPATRQLHTYSRLCEASRQFHDMIDTIHQINSLLHTGDCIFIAYSNRDEEFATFYKLEDDKVIETYYLSSGKSYPLICNQLLTRGDSLIAINTRTGYGTKVEGRSELCYSSTAPKDTIFQLRSRELMQSLRSAANEMPLSISER